MVLSKSADRCEPMLGLNAGISDACESCDNAEASLMGPKPSLLTGVS